MQIKNGFTLLETLFSLSVILFITTLSVSSINNYKIPINIVTNEIINIVELAKVDSLTKKNTNTVLFNNDNIKYDTNEYALPDHYYIKNPQSISFNKNGNVSNATTIELCEDICYSIVINLESGHIYRK